MHPRTLLLPAIIFLEILFMFCLPAYSSSFPQAFTSIGGFLAAFSFGVIILMYRPAWPSAPLRSSLKRGRVAAPALVLFCIAIPLLVFLKKLFSDTPVSIRYADIIPTIQVLCRRLLNGAAVYQPIEDFGYHLNATYLPLHWLPYLPATIFHWDERWTAFFIFGLSAFAVVHTVSKYSGALNGIIALLLIAVLLYFVCHLNPALFSVSIEIMIAAYYMLFILALGRGNAWMLAGGILLCLLSRYSLVLWLPLWALATFLYGNRKKLFISIGLIAAGVLLIYIIPFLSKDWSALPNAYKYYSVAALGEWQHLDEYGKPYHLYAGSGAAWYFYTHFSKYSIADRLHSLQKVHLILCMSTVFISGIWYLRARKKLPLTPFLLGSFKLYLAVFLMFIQVPYTYLMITGPLVSIATWAALSRYTATWQEPLPA